MLNLKKYTIHVYKQLKGMMLDIKVKRLLVLSLSEHLSCLHRKSGMTDYGTKG